MFSCSDFSRLLNLTWRYPAYFVKYSSSLFTFKFAFSVTTGNSPVKVITLSLLSVWTTCFLPHWAMLSWTWSFELQALNAMCVCHLRCTMYNAIDSSMDSTTSKTLALRRIPDQVRSIGYYLYWEFCFIHSLIREFEFCRGCAEMILKFHKAAKTSLLRVTHEKYANVDLSRVATIKPVDRLPSWSAHFFQPKCWSTLMMYVSNCYFLFTCSDKLVSYFTLLFAGRCIWRVYIHSLSESHILVRFVCL